MTLQDIKISLYHIFCDHRCISYPCIYIALAMFIIHIYYKRKFYKMHKSLFYRAELFNLLCNNIDDIFMIYHFEKSSFEYISPNFYKRYGIHSKYFIKNPASFFDYVDEDFKRTLVSYFTTDILTQNHEIEFQSINPKTKEINYQMIRIYPVYDDNMVQRYVISISDLTKEKQAQQTIKDALLNAQQANEAKKDFLSHMSHEIKTPINSIIGMVLIAQQSLDKQDKVVSCLNSISEASHNLVHLVDNILDLSKLDRNKLMIVQEPFSLNEFLGNLSSIISMQAELSHLHFTIDRNPLEHMQQEHIPTEHINSEHINSEHIYFKQYPYDKVKYDNDLSDIDLSNNDLSDIDLYDNDLSAHDLLIGDHLRLRQILQNCISNSIKFTPAGGSINLIVNEYPIQKHQIMVQFTIIDTGIGMSDEYISRIFIPFEQGSNTIYNNYGGSGLGMSIVKNLVTLMAGDIQVHSQLNKGTSVTIQIPFILRSGSKIFQKQTVQQETSNSDINFTDKRILVVEDNAINADILCELLKNTNIVIDLARNGKEALNSFEKSRTKYYDIILMDIHMPELNGLETALQIRSSNHPDANNICIIAMSADAHTEDIRKALDSGMNYHISKPLDLSILLQLLDQVLNYK